MVFIIIHQININIVSGVAGVKFKKKDSILYLKHCLKERNEIEQYI